MPEVKLAAIEFSKEQRDLGLPAIHFYILSEQARDGIEFNGTEDVWTDSVWFSYGQEPLRTTPIIRAKKKCSPLIEKRGRFALAQFLSGHVVAMIYPPESEILKTKKEAYVVAAWSNPNMVMSTKIKKLLLLTAETNLYCGCEIFPNHEASEF